MDCFCGCHAGRGGNPEGCEYCAKIHDTESPGVMAPTPEKLKELSERLVREAKGEMGPLGVVIVMVGTAGHLIPQKPEPEKPAKKTGK